MPLAVLRTDASQAIGGGHIMRCLALARALRDDGWDTLFAVSAETEATIAPSLRSDMPMSRVHSPLSPDNARAAASGNCELLVIDHYALDAAYEEVCRSWAGQILVIDDLADRPHDCDILVDPTLGRDADDYRALVPASCTVLAGSEYTLLRREFIGQRAKQRAAANRDAMPDRLFMSLGQTDAAGLIAPALDALATHLPDLAVDVAIAGSAASMPEVEEASRGHGRVTLHRDVEDMAELMSHADVALITASGTAAEAACLGLPMIMLETAANQRAVAGAFAAHRAAETATGINDAVAKLAVLTGDRDRAVSLAKRASPLYDGAGASRVALAVRPEQTHDGATVRLRPVTATDADLLLDWQCAPETRRYARDPQPPLPAAHKAWLAAKLADSGCLFHIVLCDGEPAGMVRLDLSDAAVPAYEVSIFSAPGHYRRGIGAAALRLVRRLLPTARLDAEVLSDNTASQRLFEAAGYVGDGCLYQSAPRAEFHQS